MVLNHPAVHPNAALTRLSFKPRTNLAPRDFPFLSSPNTNSRHCLADQRVRPVVAMSKPDNILFLSLRVRLRRVFCKAVERHEAPALRLRPAAPVRRRRVPDKSINAASVISEICSRAASSRRASAAHASDRSSGVPLRRRPAAARIRLQRRSLRSQQRSVPCPRRSISADGRLRVSQQSVGPHTHPRYIQEAPRSPTSARNDADCVAF